MKLQDQVTNLEISKKLKELGVKQESLFWWACYSSEANGNGNYILVNEINDDHVFVASAFTVAELGELLPKGFATVKCGDKKEIVYQVYPTLTNHFTRGKYDNVKSIFTDTEANARGKMLIYLLENKLIN